MFIDQEEKAGFARKWGRRFLKLSFVIFAFIAVFVTILANMGGNSDTLKSSAEKFISESFGNRPTVIQKLVKMTFFPSLGLEIERLQITNSTVSGSAQKSEVIAVFSKAKFFMDFWDAFFRNARFRTLLIEEGFLAKGVIGEKATEIKRLYVDYDQEKNVAEIKSSGNYGADEWNLAIGLKAIGSNGKYEYEFGEITPLSFNLADIKIAGDILKNNNSYLNIKNFSIETKEMKINGDIYASLLSSETLKIKGNVKINDEKKNIDFDLIINIKKDPVEISGNIQAKGAFIQDIIGSKSIQSVLLNLKDIMKASVGSRTPKDDFMRAVSSSNLDLKFELLQYPLDNKENAEVKFSLKQNSGNIVVNDLIGKIDSRNVEVPALAIIHEKDNYYALTAAKSLHIEDLKAIDLSLFDAQNDKSGNIDCVFGEIFANNNSDFLSKVRSIPENKTVSVDVSTLTLLNAEFSTPEEKACLKFFRQAK